MSMHVSDFDYDLPPELIAQHPCADRSASRMLRLNRGSGATDFGVFSDIVDATAPEDCLIINDTKVIASRLFGQRHPSGGQVEALLLEELAPGRWHCMLRPGRRMRPGSRVCLSDSDAGFTVTCRRADGSFEAEFSTPEVLPLLEKHGHIPLPPYIQRSDSSDDHSRYQTVYAQKPGAIAAPTAGLHFTAEIINALQAKGVRIGTVTLHVGAGTFKPVTVAKVDEHVMHSEIYELPAATAQIIRETRQRGGRVIAVGTTSVRVLESCATGDEAIVTPGAGRTRIFLYPPMQPQVVDALLTNFHLPKSTLLMLICCFCRTEHVLAAYRQAIEKRLRFYSYGDCMFIY